MYMEQLGVNLQDCGIRGDSTYWYTRVRPMMR
jgi:hypothetical protein